MPAILIGLGSVIKSNKFKLIRPLFYNDQISWYNSGMIILYKIISRSVIFYNYVWTDNSWVNMLTPMLIMLYVSIVTAETLEHYKIKKFTQIPAIFYYYSDYSHNIDMSESLHCQDCFLVNCKFFPHIENYRSQNLLRPVELLELLT